MKTKQLVLLAVIILAVGAYLFSGKFKTEQPQPRQAQPTAQKQEHNHPPTTVLPTVTEVTLAIKNVDETLYSPITLKVGEVKKLTGTPYSLSVKEFHSHWNFDDRPVNISFNEANPAIKVDVMSNDSILYYQWAFKNMEFFGGGPTARHMTGAEKDFLFTLLDYKGFSIPEEAHDHGGGS
jgi:hypothetical protein